jgi:hypothetical protein
MVVSLLVRLMLTPFTGAGDTRLTDSGTDWPTPTVRLAGSTITPNRPTFRLAEPFVYCGAVAVTVVPPFVSPVAVKDPVTPPLGIVTMEGCKATTPPGDVDRLTLTPAA